MPEMKEVSIAPLHSERFESVLTPEQYEHFQEVAGQARELFRGRKVWNVNSTATGGGVAEMLRSLLAYARGAGIDTRWVVIAGTPEFFKVTKRIHNHLHGAAGDGGSLGATEREIYARALEPNGRELADMVSDRDVVLLHDPQTAGLIPAIKRSGARVIWRCHVGLDLPNELARTAWRFLLPFVSEADAYVFSRQTFAWEGLEPAKTWVIPPSIDAFSPKNEDLAPGAVIAILQKSGVIGGPPADGQAEFTRGDGSTGRITHRAEIFEHAPAPAEAKLVVQVSRWDALKDPLGVLEGFDRHIDPSSDSHLVLAGPAVEAVVDDPEGKQVLEDVIARWRSSDPETQRRSHLACLPMVDGDENAAIVNALQRHAHVVVQKSLAEGFGLTVAEAMWKARPVVASKIGGIQDQVRDGVTGVLLDDPRDLAEFGQKVTALLTDEERAARLGKQAQLEVRDHFLGPRHLLQYVELVGSLFD
jgi:trehalose synthase